MARDGTTTDLGSLLATVFQKKNWQRRLGLHQVFFFWDKVVGVEIAAHAQPDIIKGDVLWLKVSDSIWMQQLQFEKQNILVRLNKRLDRLAVTGPAKNNSTDKDWRLSDLRFSIGKPLPIKSATDNVTEQAAPVLSVVDEAKLADFNQLLTNIEDPKLQDSMRRLWLTIEGRKNS